MEEFDGDNFNHNINIRQSSPQQQNDHYEQQWQQLQMDGGELRTTFSSSSNSNNRAEEFNFNDANHLGRCYQDRHHLSEYMLPSASASSAVQNVETRQILKMPYSYDDRQRSQKYQEIRRRESIICPGVDAQTNNILPISSAAMTDINKSALSSCKH